MDCKKFIEKGFHGAYKSIANNIINDRFTYKTSDKHWLGQGFYFYTDFNLAKWWIIKKIEYEMNKKNNNIALKPAVIAVDIKANKNLLLDLDNNKDMDKYIDFIKKYLAWANENNMSIKLKKDPKSKRKNSCFMLDIMKKHKGIEIVKQTFSKDNPSYANYDLKRFQKDYFEFDLSYKETQICVSKNTHIYNKRLVYSESDL